MMEYTKQPNLLLEALAYLGRRASGHTWEQMEQRLRERRVTIPAAFLEMLDELKALTARLDTRTRIDEETLELFKNLEGFPRNTVGTGSPAFLLFYGMLEYWKGDIPSLINEIDRRTPGQTAWHMALAMDLGEECHEQELDAGEFLELTLSAALPDSTRITVLDTYRRSRELTERITAALVPVLEALEQERNTLNTLARALGSKIDTLGCEEYLNRTSRLQPAPGIAYRLRPFLFGMDTHLTSDEDQGMVQIYCGIGREELLQMLTVQTPVQDDVYKAFKLLGDRTRFDILCYLRSRSAYGQELGNHFGLSRNTIHHHMNKLADYGLVRCATDGNRIYYSVDHAAMAALLELQKRLFLEDGQ